MVHAVIERPDAPRIPHPHIRLDCEGLGRAGAAINRHLVRDKRPGIETPVGSNEQAPGLIKSETERAHVAALGLKVLFAAQNLCEARTGVQAPNISRLTQDVDFPAAWPEGEAHGVLAESNDFADGKTFGRFGQRRVISRCLECLVRFEFRFTANGSDLRRCNRITRAVPCVANERQHRGDLFIRQENRRHRVVVIGAVDGDSPRQSFDQRANAVLCFRHQIIRLRQGRKSARRPLPRTLVANDAVLEVKQFASRDDRGRFVIRGAQGNRGERDETENGKLDQSEHGANLSQRRIASSANRPCVRQSVFLASPECRLWQQ